MVLIDEIDDEDLLCPIVFWAQRKETISLKVNISDAKNPKVNMTETSFDFQVRANGAQGLHFYKFHLDFFKEIDPESCVYKITPSYVDIQITKQGPGEWWPRLLPENFRKPHYLKLDFDRWKTESEDEEVDEVDEKEVQMEQLKEALQADMDRQQDLMFSKNFYLFLYNAIQFLLFFTITASCLLGYAFQQNTYFSRVYYSLGSMVIFAVSLTYLEPIHALTGVTNSHWLAPFLLPSGRLFALLCLWLGGNTVQRSPAVWCLYLAWSIAEVIRYPMYMLQVVNREIKIITWLRYHSWILLFPLGVFCEYLVIVGAATTLRKDNLYSFSVPGTSFTLDLSAFLRAYIVLLVVGLFSVMRHMWKMRSKKYGSRRKLKPA